MEENTNIWDFNFTVSRRLLAWNLANIAVGAMLSRRDKFWAGVGSQNMGWGVINIAIALGGAVFTEYRLETSPDPLEPQLQEKETRNLRNILWFNAGLDILYMLGGWWFAQSRKRKNQRGRGVGVGIIIQGALLFVFDVVHALALTEREK